MQLIDHEISRKEFNDGCTNLRVVAIGKVCWALVCGSPEGDAHIFIDNEEEACTAYDNTDTVEEWNGLPYR